MLCKYFLTYLMLKQMAHTVITVSSVWLNRMEPIMASAFTNRYSIRPGTKHTVYLPFAITASWNEKARSVFVSFQGTWGELRAFWTSKGTCEVVHISGKWRNNFLLPGLIYLLNCILCAFLWVILRRLNFIGRRFGALCLFQLNRQVGVKNELTYLLHGAKSFLRS